MFKDENIFWQLGDLERITDIKNKAVKTVGKLNAEYVKAKEPIPFDKRAENNKKLRRGVKWASVFDCGWFHFTGDIPEKCKGKNIGVVIDQLGEGLVVDENGNALKGLSHPFILQTIAEFFNAPIGKTMYRLSDGEAASGKVDLWVETGFNGRFGQPSSYGVLNRANIVAYDTEILNLYYDYLALAFAKSIYKGEEKRQAENALLKAYAKFIRRDIKGAREALKPMLDRKSDLNLTVTAVGHSHLDLGWLWPVRESRRKAARTFATAVKNMELFPEYVYGASQPQQLEWVKEDYPELFKKLQDAAKRGQFEPQGGMWCECDTNIPGGESLIRQFVYGLDFWKKEFGADVKNCWLPDVFGYSAALPQIIKKCGMDYFMTQKLSWNEHNEFPYETFIWEGLSKDNVLTHMLPGNTYNSSCCAPSNAELYRNHVRKGAADEALMLFGAGDGGGGPAEANIELLERYKDFAGLPKIKMGKAADFFESINGKRDGLPEHKGELYFEKHQGTYTTQSNNKKLNRKAEFAMHDLEALAAYAATKGYEYPKEKTDKIWKEILLYQFHDILPGSSITRVYKESVERYKEIIDEIDAERDNALSFLKKSDDGLTAVNTAPFGRKDVLKHDGKWYSSEAGAYSAAEMIELTDVPCAINCGTDFIENEFLIASFAPDGSIRSLIEKKTKNEFNGDFLNKLNVYRDKKTQFNAWDIDINYTKKKPEEMELLLSRSYLDGQSAVMLNTYFYNFSSVVQKVILTAGRPYVEFECDVDWHERNKMLRAEFRPSVYSDKATCNIQFGNIERSTRTDNKVDWAQFEVAAHKFVDVSDGERGSALLTKYKYGFRVKDGLISLNLLRAPVNPDKKADRGEHRFGYAFYPHSGDCYESEVPKLAYLYNLAPVVTEGAVELPELVSVSAANVIVETVKPAENGSGTVLRIYESEGKTAETTLATAFKGKIYETDMLENVIEETGKTLKFEPYEIKTLLIK